MRGEEKETERQGGIQVLARAAAVLRTLANNPQGLSLGAIAQKVNLPRSTVQRIVCTLETEGLAESLGPSGGFRLGPELSRLIYQTQIDIISFVQPLLSELSRKLAESVVLCAREKDQILVLDRVVAERELRVVFPVGLLRAPLHTNAPGKALLATMSDDEVKRLLPDPLPGARKSRKRATLIAELKEIRASGIATEYEESLEGLAGFAASVSTYFGDFAIAAVTPVSRAHGSIKAIKQALLECKRDIEQKIGSRPQEV